MRAGSFVCLLLGLAAAGVAANNKIPPAGHVSVRR
jgi:hypothetical protein